MIACCCMFNALILGLSPMVSDNTWDWGYAYTLGAETVLGALGAGYVIFFKKAITEGVPQTRVYFFVVILLGAVLFMSEAASRLFMIWYCLNEHDSYYMSPKSTHMYYGLYLVAALGDAVLGYVWLVVAVLGGVMHWYPYGVGDLTRKRREYFDTDHTIAAVQLSNNSVVEDPGYVPSNGVEYTSSQEDSSVESGPNRLPVVHLDIQSIPNPSGDMSHCLPQLVNMDASSADSVDDGPRVAGDAVHHTTHV
ncbi:hypothetical protein KIPB_007703 [Kipferlia bialata]|uniref:Uncharacterized protein n=1 Tax=Kipferlia bialata TaxID=797122 RepID=A0A9K3CYX8_9EUKA|nr:hypothetical protein KIPB_007703 [Kipferlia bialata]|eukprot:g7703.t1